MSNIRVCVCVCVCVAGILTDSTSTSFMNGFIRVVNFHRDQNLLSAGRSVGSRSLSFGKAGGRPISHFLVKSRRC